MRIKDFEERIEEIGALYAKAVDEEEYTTVMENSLLLREEMEKAGCILEEIAEAVFSGFFARYYWIRKFFINEEVTEGLKEEVKKFYERITDPLLKVRYGYLLAIIVGELEEDFDEAKRLNKEIRQIAESTGNISEILREINSRGLQAAKEGNHILAIKIFSEIEAFTNIPEKAFRHAGNILNNRGASKIRGDISPIDGAVDLIAAVADYYLREEEPSLKHLDGIRNRLREAQEKIKQ